jgi:hypothetical protein
MAGLKKVWLAMDFCQERCEVLALSAGFTLEGPADLDLANAWNKDHRFSRAYVDEEGNIRLESELDLSGGVSLGGGAGLSGAFPGPLPPRLHGAHRL